MIFQPDYKKIAKYCNVWRNFDDINDSWDSVASIIEFYGKDHSKFIEVAGPGNFNDPDMVIDFVVMRNTECVVLRWNGVEVICQIC